MRRIVWVLCRKNKDSPKLKDTMLDSFINDQHDSFLPFKISITSSDFKMEFGGCMCEKIT